MVKNEVVVNFREKLVNLENDLMECVDGVNIVTEQDTNLFPLKHTFGDEMYARQMSMNKGSWCIGKIHKQNHIWFLLTGKITVVTDGDEVDHIAPCYTKADSGAKRIIYAHEDSVFITIHNNPDNIRDIDELEKHIVTKTYEEYEEYINKNK